MTVNDVKLGVPYYKQIVSGTCGPAALMMCMKFWNNSFRLLPQTELLFWQEAALLPLRITTAVGLALVAARRGYCVAVFSEKDFAMPKMHKQRLFHESFGSTIDVKSLSAITYVAQRKLLERNSSAMLFDRKINIDEIVHFLLLGIPVATMVYDRMFADDFLHWIVVKGHSKLMNIFYLNDPSALRCTEISSKRLSRALNVGLEKSFHALAIVPKSLENKLQAVTGKRSNSNNSIKGEG